MSLQDLHEKYFNSSVPLRDKFAQVQLANSTPPVVPPQRMDYVKPATPAPVEFGLPGKEVKPPTPKSYMIKDRGVNVLENEIEDVLKPMLYSEISPFGDKPGQRPKEKVELEMRAIANTVFNRAKNRKKTVDEVINEENQYQGVGSKKFKNFKTNTDELEKEQIDFINDRVKQIVSEIEAGTFEDNVGGAEFYGHLKDGTLRAFDTWDQYKQALKEGLVK